MIKELGLGEKTVYDRISVQMTGQDDKRELTLNRLLQPFLRGRIRLHQLPCLVKRSKTTIR
jgi:hypothetical protein